jgi:PAS domain S-box-containing protein
VNKAYCDYFGKSREELIGEKFTKFIHPDDAQFVANEIASLNQENRSITYEHRVIDERGNIRWQQWNDHMIFDENDNFIEYQSVGRDITQRKIMEEKLRQREEYINALMENATDIITIHDENGIINFVSPNVENLLGYAPEELLGDNIFKIIHPDDVQVTIQAMDKILDNPHTPHINQVRMLDKNADYRYIESIGTNFLDNPIIRGIVVNSRDVTYRKRAEQKIRESKERFQYISELVSDYMYVLTMKPNGWLIREWVSDAINRITGYTFEELDKLNGWQNLAHPDDREEVVRHRKAFKSGKTDISEYRIVTKDGSIRWLKDYTRPIWDKEGNRVVKIIGAAQDITERKSAEEALKQSEKKYKDLVETIDEWIWEIDRSGKSIYNSPKVKSITGYEPSQLHGKLPIELMPPSEADRVYNFFQESISQKKPFKSYECVIRHKNGRKIIIESSGTPFFNGNGNLQGFRGINRDITAKKIAEEELNRSRERFRKLYENATIGLYRTTPDGKILMANPALVKMLGYESLEELSSNRNLEKDGFEPDYPRTEFKRWLDEKGEIHGLEEGWTRKDGTIIYVRESARVIKDEDGNPIYYEGTVEDVTERKLAEMAKRESEEKYRTIFLNAPLGVFRSTPEGKFLEVNPVLAEMLGYDNPQEVLDDIDDIAEQIYIKTEKRRDIVKDTIESKNVLRYVNWYKKKDGTHFVANLTLKTIFDKAGNILYLLGIVEDITERQKAQEQIRKSLREKVALLKEIHHRVKNNMQVISSLMYIQSQKTAGEKCRDILQETQERVKSMALVHEKMYKSKDLAQIDISEYINSLASELFYAYNPNHSDIRLNIDAHNTLMRIDTAIPCGLIINELITNALKHGFPERSDGEINVEFFEQDDEYILIVSDDGIDFPQDIQVETPQSMGLELIKDLTTEQLKGNIELDRTNGAIFKIVFPKPDYKESEENE